MCLGKGECTVVTEFTVLIKGKFRKALKLSKKVKS